MLTIIIIIIDPLTRSKLQVTNYVNSTLLQLHIVLLNSI